MKLYWQFCALFFLVPFTRADIFDDILDAFLDAGGFVHVETTVSLTTTLQWTVRAAMRWWVSLKPLQKSARVQSYRSSPKSATQRMYRIRMCAKVLSGWKDLSLAILSSKSIREGRRQPNYVMHFWGCAHLQPSNRGHPSFRNQSLTNPPYAQPVPESRPSRWSTLVMCILIDSTLWAITLHLAFSLDLITNSLELKPTVTSLSAVETTLISEASRLRNLHLKMGIITVICRLRCWIVHSMRWMSMPEMQNWPSSPAMLWNVMSLNPSTSCSDSYLFSRECLARESAVSFLVLLTPIALINVGITPKICSPSMLIFQPSYLFPYTVPSGISTWFIIYIEIISNLLCSEGAPVNSFPRNITKTSYSAQWIFDTQSEDWEKWIREEAAGQLQHSSGSYASIVPDSKLMWVLKNPIIPRDPNDLNDLKDPFH